MKNKLARKLLVSVMILVATVALAGASTYAWFTMNDNPEVTNFDLYVTAGDGLYISLIDTSSTAGAYSDTTAVAIKDWNNGAGVVGKTGTFVSILDGTNVAKLLDTLYPFTTESGVTGVPGTADAKRRLPLTHGTQHLDTDGTTLLADDDFADPFHIAVVDDGTGTGFAGPRYVLSAGDVKNYLETTAYSFRIYFQSAAPYKVSLDLTKNNGATPNPTYLGSQVSSATGAGAPIKSWNTATTSYDKQLGKTTYALPGSVGTNIDASAKDAVRIGFYDGTTKKVWDPNYDEGFTDNITGNIAYDYYKFSTGISGVSPIVLPAADILGRNYQVNPMNYDTRTTPANALLTTLTGTGTYNGYLDVTIWLEGWDANAFNSVLQHIITTKLVFKGTLA